MTRAFIRHVAWLALIAPLVAQEPGKVSDPVVTRADAAQSYALYLPSAYTPQKKWPVILLFDPGARGRVAVETFRAAAEKHGFILAGSNNSRNGPLRPALEAFSAMHQDVVTRFAVDGARIYAAGFSGGARVAGHAAVLCEGCISAVVACGAGLPRVEAESLPRLPAYFFAIGVYDANYYEALDAARSLRKPRVVAVFDGGHDWPPPDVAERALAWLAAGAQTTEAPPVLADEAEQRRKEERLVARFSTLLNAILAEPAERAQNLGDLRRELATLRKEREKAPTKDQLALRRALGRAFIGTYELSHAQSREKNLELAAQLLEASAAGVEPSAGLAYETASAWAAAGQKKKSLAALREAIELGFKDKQALAANKDFDALRAQDEFKAIASTIP